MNIAGTRINEPIIKVRHSGLKLVEPDAPHRKKMRMCPVCQKGVLLVRREPSPSFKMLAEDHCTLCGQRFEFLDIEEMRNNDWAPK